MPGEDDLPPLRFDCDGVFRTLGVDPFTGQQRELAFVAERGMVERRTIREADMDRFFAANQELQNERPKGSMRTSRGANFLRVARIPGPVHELWLSILGTPKQNPEGWKQRLRDPANRKFLTSGYTP